MNWATIMGTKDLQFHCFFIVFAPGDRVRFLQDNGNTVCEGVITEQYYDANTNITYGVRIEYCNHWDKFAIDTEVAVAQSQLIFLANGQIDDR